MAIFNSYVKLREGKDSTLCLIASGRPLDLDQPNKEQHDICWLVVFETIWIISMYGMSMDVILPIDSNIVQDSSNMFKVPTSMGRLGLDVFFFVSERRVISSVSLVELAARAALRPLRYGTHERAAELLLPHVPGKGLSNQGERGIPQRMNETAIKSC